MPLFVLIHRQPWSSLSTPYTTSFGRPSWVVKRVNVPVRASKRFTPPPLVPTHSTFSGSAGSGQMEKMVGAESVVLSPGTCM